VVEQERHGKDGQTRIYRDRHGLKIVVLQAGALSSVSVPALIQVRNATFCDAIYTYNASFYQDRLGTNIGKALKKRVPALIQTMTSSLFLIALSTAFVDCEADQKRLAIEDSRSNDSLIYFDLDVAAYRIS
jgi:hypothetical protein